MEPGSADLEAFTPNAAEFAARARTHQPGPHLALLVLHNYLPLLIS